MSEQIRKTLHSIEAEARDLLRVVQQDHSRLQEPMRSVEWYLRGAVRELASARLALATTAEEVAV